MAGAFMTARAIMSARSAAAREMIAAVEEAFRDVDVLLCASSMDPASRIEDMPPRPSAPIRARRARRSTSPAIRRWR
jgi:aspartyl-tRNA(Asn)/glutamyl-tRNA(Gln) amidotransferase subunit A